MLYWIQTKSDVHVTVHQDKFPTLKPTRCTNFSNLFLEWNSICFGQFLYPSSGFCLPYAQQWYMPYRFAGSKPVWHIPLLCVQWKTPDDGHGNWPKHLEFHSKHKSDKLVHLVGFIVGNKQRITVKHSSLIFAFKCHMLCFNKPSMGIIHSIGMCRMRWFLAVLRSFFHSSLLCTFSCHPSPPTLLPSSLTSSCRLFLGLVPFQTTLLNAVSQSVHDLVNNWLVLSLVGPVVRRKQMLQPSRIKWAWLQCALIIQTRWCESGQRTQDV